MIELPQITDPLGAYWDQPKSDQMAVYNDIAIMDQIAVDALLEYSTSIPTGTYEGKMWKCRHPDGWQLCWYGASDDPDMISINRRPIRIIKPINAVSA